MKRSTRYRIAKFNRSSTEIRYWLWRQCSTPYYWMRYPEEWAAAKAMIERDKAARIFLA